MAKNRVPRPGLPPTRPPPIELAGSAPLEPDEGAASSLTSGRRKWSRSPSAGAPPMLRTGSCRSPQNPRSFFMDAGARQPGRRTPGVTVVSSPALHEPRTLGCIHHVGPASRPARGGDLWAEAKPSASPPFFFSPCSFHFLFLGLNNSPSVLKLAFLFH